MNEEAIELAQELKDYVAIVGKQNPSINEVAARLLIILKEET